MQQKSKDCTGRVSRYLKRTLGEWFKVRYRCYFGIGIGIAGQANRESHVLRKLLRLHLATPLKQKMDEQNIVKET